MSDLEAREGVFIENIVNEAEKSPGADLLNLRVGPYWVVVDTSVGAGMASAMRSEAHIHGSRPITGAGELHVKTPLELVQLLRSDSPPEAGIGLAAANAILASEVSDLSEEKAVGILCDRGAGRKVAMIGHFPFADRLREHCDQLWVFERGLNHHEGDLDGDAMDELLPQADVVAVTATTLLNRTLGTVMAGVRSDAFVMMLGPSTPLTPVLLDFGFDVLCGTIIEDPESVLRAVEQGAVTPQITGVRRVSLWR